MTVSVFIVLLCAPTRGILLHPPMSKPADKILKSGSIWKKSPLSRQRIIKAVCKTFRREYGLPRLGNPSDPLDDLLCIILSNKTAPAIANDTYARLRAKFAEWDDILKAPIEKLRTLLKPAGLSRIKSSQIRAALRTIERKFGRCDLRRLKRWTPREAEDFLVSLPGVSEKVAKCVMMYTLSMQVLPVDSHVHRVASRLGWTKRKRADQCHAELEALVAPPLRKTFHVCCIAHGRKICRPENPLCNACPVRRYCAFYEATR